MKIGTGLFIASIVYVCVVGMVAPSMAGIVPLLLMAAFFVCTGIWCMTPGGTHD